MSIDHNGVKTPVFDDGLYPEDEDTFYISWEDITQAGQTISASAWTVTAGLAIESQLTDQTVTDRVSGTVFTNCNGVRISVDADADPGLYYAYNTATFTSGPPYQITRDFALKVLAKK